jgi:hypothetical protein
VQWTLIEVRCVYAEVSLSSANQRIFIGTRPGFFLGAWTMDREAARSSQALCCRVASYGQEAVYISDVML